MSIVANSKETVIQHQPVELKDSELQYNCPLGKWFYSARYTADSLNYVPQCSSLDQKLCPQKDGFDLMDIIPEDTIGVANGRYLQSEIKVNCFYREKRPAQMTQPTQSDTSIPSTSSVPIPKTIHYEIKQNPSLINNSHIFNYRGYPGLNQPASPPPLPQTQPITLAPPMRSIPAQPQPQKRGSGSTGWVILAFVLLILIFVGIYLVIKN